MKLDGKHVFNAPRTEIWDLLMDPDVIATTIPGCNEMEASGDGVYHAKITVGVAGVKGIYTSEIKLTDKIAPESYKLNLQGKGARGFLNGQVSIRLEEEGQNTVMHYTAENHVGGPIASVGQRVFGAAAKMIVKQGFKALEKQLAQRRQTS